MSDPIHVGTAIGGSKVTVSGDIVGRDKIVTQDHARAIKQVFGNYLSAVAQENRVLPQWPSQNLRTMLERVEVAELFLDVRTDILRAGSEVEQQARPSDQHYSVLQALLETPRLILVGPRGSGKTTALRVLIKLLGVGHSPIDTVPVLLDSSDDFGRWLVDHPSHETPDFIAFIQASWGINLADLIHIGAQPAFLWDHCYQLNMQRRLAITALVKALQRWFPKATHVITSRSVVTSGLEPLVDFEAARILPLEWPTAVALLAQYSRKAHVHFSRTLRASSFTTNAHDLLAVAAGESQQAWSLEYTKVLQAGDIDPRGAQEVVSHLPRLCWELLRRHPDSMSYYVMQDRLTDSRRELAEPSAALIDQLVDRALISLTEVGRYVLQDIASAESLAIDALDDVSILRESLEAVSVAPRVFDLVERSAALHASRAVSGSSGECAP